MTTTADTAEGAGDEAYAAPPYFEPHGGDEGDEGGKGDDGDDDFEPGAEKCQAIRASSEALIEMPRALGQRSAWASLSSVIV